MYVLSFGIWYLHGGEKSSTVMQETHNQSALGLPSSITKLRGDTQGTGYQEE